MLNAITPVSNTDNDFDITLILNDFTSNSANDINNKGNRKVEITSVHAALSNQRQGH